MAFPLVSIIMAAHNAERFLRRAIDSALGQTYRNIELIVIDDASTDGTAEIIASYNDPRIVPLRNEQNLHISASTNRGIAAARGAYIAILDSDDAWYPEKLEKQVTWMEAHPETGACFTWVTVVDQDGKPWTAEQEPLVSNFRQENRPHLQWLHDLLLSENCLCHPSVLYRRSALEKAGAYDPMLAQLLDYEVYLRLLAHSDLHILCEPLMDYRRLHNKNVSNSAGDGAPIWRTRNETPMVVCDALLRMPAELFGQAFAAELTVKPFDPDLALFEKGMLLYRRFEDETIRRAGLAMIRRGLDTEDKLKKAEQAGFSRMEYFTWTAFEDQHGMLARMRARESSLRGILSITKAWARGKGGAKLRTVRIARRKGVNALKGRLRRFERFYMLLGACKRAVTKGPSTAWRELKDTIRIRNARIAKWPTEEERAAQRADCFPRNIKISVLVPLYNTPEKFLREMIESVRAQTYENWELCLADGSGPEHADVGRICAEYAAADPRVRYQKLERNLGLSGNTNAALDMAEGEYIALLDHDDLLHPAALHEVMRAICDRDAELIYTDEAHFHETPDNADVPNFKPDFAPDMLRSCNYICHLTVFSRALLQKAGGGFRSEYDGSQDYDLILRLTEQTEKIVHIPRILYLWRVHAASTASDIAAKPYVLDAARRAIAAHLERVGLRGTVHDARSISTYDVRYEIERQDLVSIIIPTRDHAGDLKRCIDSIRAKTTYPNWEIVLVENNSADAATFRYYEELQSDARIRLTTYQGDFNYSAINNFGVRHAKGQYFLLLNNDTEVITPDWIERMLMFAQRPDVGAVGCMLYYPDDTVQHAGVILGLGGIAGHGHKYCNRRDVGFMSRMAIVQNLSAVTAACAMFPRRVWEQVHGLDEDFAVAFNDIDLCLRIRQAGYLIVWTPEAQLYHYESRSRGKDNTLAKQERFAGEIERFRARWQAALDAGDPYYNPNLTLKRENFSLR